jgi:hypothetical protein
MTYKCVMHQMACAAITLSLFISAQATTKHEMEIFGKWHAWQQVFYDPNIAELKDGLDDAFLNSFKNTYQKNVAALRHMNPVLSGLTNGMIGPDGFQLRSPMDEQMKLNLAILYDQIEKSMPEFIESLMRLGINNAITAQEEEQSHYDIVIEKYKAFSNLLFSQTDSFKQGELIFAFGNRLFEYAFDPKTFSHFKKLMTSHELYPAARFVNAIVWHSLVGDGWKHWHANALESVVAKAAQGDELVYLAGGTDFYQLLRKGVRNITIIDTFLPTQERFYSEGWMFLLNGDDGTCGIDDEIRFGPECDSIKMKRVDFKEGEPFYSKLSNGKILTLKKTVTTWHVFDRHDKHVGHVVLCRRPVNQDDFAVRDKVTFLMSYDELAHCSLPDVLNGWGIEPSLMDDAIQIYSKQHRKPLTKQHMLNMRLASMINLADMKFINLGSDPT